MSVLLRRGLWQWWKYENSIKSGCATSGDNLGQDQGAKLTILAVNTHILGLSLGRGHAGGTSFCAALDLLLHLKSEAIEIQTLNARVLNARVLHARVLTILTLGVRAQAVRSGSFCPTVLGLNGCNFKDFPASYPSEGDGQCRPDWKNLDLAAPTSPVFSTFALIYRDFQFPGLNLARAAMKWPFAFAASCKKAITLGVRLPHQSGLRQHGADISSKRGRVSHGTKM